MKTTRHGVFETNSSSTHAIAILSDADFKKLKEDRNLWYHKDHGIKTKEEAIKLLPDYYKDDIEQGATWPLCAEDWFNVEEWHDDLEQDEHEYTSEHGDKIHIICAYGYE
jgi:hypothetical protein